MNVNGKMTTYLQLAFTLEMALHLLPLKLGHLVFLYITNIFIFYRVIGALDPLPTE